MLVILHTCPGKLYLQREIHRRIQCENIDARVVVVYFVPCVTGICLEHSIQRYCFSEFDFRLKKTTAATSSAGSSDSLHMTVKIFIACVNIV